MTHGKYILTLPFCHGHGQRGAFSPIPSLLLGWFSASPTPTLPKASSTLYFLVRALRLRSPLFFTRAGIFDDQIKTSYSGLGARSWSIWPCLPKASIAPLLLPNGGPSGSQLQLERWCPLLDTLYITRIFLFFQDCLKCALIWDDEINEKLMTRILRMEQNIIKYNRA